MTRSVLLCHELNREIHELRRMYLVAGASQTVPSKYDFRQGDAYLIAAHAAIEFYLEELCRMAVYRAVKAYESRNQRGQLLRDLCASHFGRNVGLLPRSEFNFAQGVFEVDDTVKWYIKRISENEGLKRKNVLSLLLPLGFGEPDIDTVWIADMEAFGKHRGDIAHGRPSSVFGKPPVIISRGPQPFSITVWNQTVTRTRQQFTPANVDTLLPNLLPELYNWDLRLMELTSSKRLSL